MGSMLLELLRQQQGAVAGHGIELRALRRPHTAPSKKSRPAAAVAAPAAEAAPAARPPSPGELELAAIDADLDAAPDAAPCPQGAARPQSAVAARRYSSGARLDYGPNPASVEEAAILSSIGQEMLNSYPQPLRAAVAKRPVSAPSCHEILRNVQAKKEKQLRDRPPPRKVVASQHAGYVVRPGLESKLLRSVHLKEFLDECAAPGQPLPGKTAWARGATSPTKDSPGLDDVKSLECAPLGRGHPGRAPTKRRVRNHKKNFFNAAASPVAFAAPAADGWFEGSSSLAYLDAAHATDGVTLEVGGEIGRRTLTKTVKECHKLRKTKMSQSRALAEAQAAAAAETEEERRAEHEEHKRHRDRLQADKKNLAEDIRAMKNEIDTTVEAVRKAKGFRQTQMTRALPADRRESQYSQRRRSVGLLEFDSRTTRLDVMYTRWTAHAQEFMEVLGEELKDMPEYKRVEYARALRWEVVLAVAKAAFNKVMTRTRVAKMRGANWDLALEEYLAEENYPSTDKQPWPDRVSFVDFFMEQVCEDMNSTQFDEFSKLLSAEFTTDDVVAEEKRRLDEVDPILLLLEVTSPTIAVSDPSLSPKAADRREQSISVKMLREFTRVADRHLCHLITQRALHIGGRFASHLEGYSLASMMPTLEAVSVFELPHGTARRCIVEAISFATALEFDLVLQAMWMAARAVVSEIEQNRGVIAPRRTVYRMTPADLEWVLRAATPRRMIGLHSASHFDVRSALDTFCRTQDIPLSLYFVSHLATEEMLLRQLPALMPSPHVVVVALPLSVRDSFVRNLTNALLHLPVTPSPQFRCFACLAPCLSANGLPRAIGAHNALVVNVDTVRLQPRHPEATGEAWQGRNVPNETQIYPFRHTPVDRNAVESG